MITNYPFVKSLLALHPYTNSLLDNPKKHIFNRDSIFFTKDYAQYTKERQKIINQHDTEIENIYIQISYSKNINEIKQIFSEAGLTF